MKYVTIVILFVLTITKSEAQAYHPLVDTTNIWNVEWQTFEYNGGLIFYYDGYRYWLSGDTQVNGLQYKKLFSQWVYRFVTNGYPQYDYWYNINYPPELIAGLREDSTSKKVWCYDFGGAFLSFISSAGDTLLYDFNVSIGDTLKWTPEQFVVTDIDSFQLLNGEWRRRIVLDIWGGPHYWIEGIGATEVLSQPYFIYFEILSQLTCFTNNSLLLYQNPPYGIPLDKIVSCDSLATGVHNVDRTKGELILSPNLVSKNFHLLFQSSEIKSATFLLRDLFGRTVYQDPIQANHNYIVDASPLPEGIFIAELISNDMIIWSEKICIQKN